MRIFFELAFFDDDAGFRADSQRNIANNAREFDGPVEVEGEDAEKRDVGRIVSMIHLDYADEFGGIERMGFFGIDGN